MFQARWKSTWEVDMTAGWERRPNVRQRRGQTVDTVLFVDVRGQYCRNFRQSVLITVQFSKVSKNSEPSEGYSGKKWQDLTFNVVKDPGWHVKEPIHEGEEAEEKNIDHSDAHSEGHSLAERGKIYESLGELVQCCAVLIFDGGMQT